MLAGSGKLVHSSLNFFNCIFLICQKSGCEEHCFRATRKDAYYRLQYAHSISFLLCYLSCLSSSFLVFRFHTYTNNCHSKEAIKWKWKTRSQMVQTRTEVTKDRVFHLCETDCVIHTYILVHRIIVAIKICSKSFLLFVPKWLKMI